MIKKYLLVIVIFYKLIFTVFFLYIYEEYFHKEGDSYNYYETLRKLKYLNQHKKEWLHFILWETQQTYLWKVPPKDFSPSLRPPYLHDFKALRYSLLLYFFLTCRGETTM